MAKRKKASSGPGPVRRAVDWLLVASVACVGVIAAAYVWLPDVQRGFSTLVDQGGAAFGLVN